MKISALSLAVLVSSLAGAGRAVFVIDDDCRSKKTADNHYKAVQTATEDVIFMANKVISRLLDKKDLVALNLHQVLFEVNRVTVEDAFSEFLVIPGSDEKVTISCTENALKSNINMWNPNAKVIDPITGGQVKVKDLGMGREKLTPCEQFPYPEAYTVESSDGVHIVLCWEVIHNLNLDKRDIQTIIKEGPDTMKDLSYIRPLSFIILTQLLSTHIIRDSSAPAMRNVAVEFEACASLDPAECILNPYSYGFLAVGLALQEWSWKDGIPKKVGLIQKLGFRRL